MQIRKTLPALAAILFSSTLAMAQTEVKEKQEFRIKTVKIENGKKTVIDTSFSSKADFDQFMEENGMPMHGGQGTEDIDVRIEKTPGSKKETKTVKKVIRYEISDDDSMSKEEMMKRMEIDMEDLKGIEVMEVENVDIDELVKKYSDGKDVSEVRVIMIKRSIEVEDVSPEEQKGANLVNPSGSNLDMSLQPNPADDIVHMTLAHSSHDGVIETGEVRVMDMAGKIVKTIPVNLNQNGTDLDVSDLSAGSYIVRFATYGAHAVKKLIIE